MGFTSIYVEVGVPMQLLWGPSITSCYNSHSDLSRLSREREAHSRIDHDDVHADLYKVNQPNSRETIRLTPKFPE